MGEGVGEKHKMKEEDRREGASSREKKREQTPAVEMKRGMRDNMREKREQTPEVGMKRGMRDNMREKREQTPVVGE